MNRKSLENSDQVKADIKVKLLPRSSKNEIIGREDDVLKVKVTAPPVEGKANKALEQLLAKRLDLPKSNVEIISGERSRVKSIRIHGLSNEDVTRMLMKDP
jgi:uncharacterized protein (TIGR00251 family)